MSFLITGASVVVFLACIATFYVVRWLDQAKSEREIAVLTLALAELQKIVRMHDFSCGHPETTCRENNCPISVDRARLLVTRASASIREDENQRGVDGE